MPSGLFSFGLEFVFPRVCKNAQAFNPDKQLLTFASRGVFNFWFEVMFNLY